tara:strand:- start:35405 stop:35692 length:288 start_codon:yes stop_codon:yes gene_type:complete
MARLKDHLNAPPELVSWVATRVVFWPILVVRVAIIVGVCAIWSYQAPQIAALVWSSSTKAEKTPIENRAPKRSQAMQKLLDDLNDVRARISEQMP